MTNYIQERVHNYIATYTGKQFDFDQLSTEAVDIVDIAHALSNICRYTGHSPRFYSVAEHSMFCSYIADMEKYTPLQKLYILLHDASEAYVNDLARPLKQNLPEYIDMENKVSALIWEAFGLPAPTDDDYKLIKAIDNTVLMNEMESMMNRADYHPDLDFLPQWKGRFDMNKMQYGAGEAKFHFIMAFEKFMKEYQELEEAEETKDHDTE